MINDLINKIKQNIVYVSLLCIVGIIVVSCASIASPSGGDYDFDPPIFISSTPIPNELQVKGRKIEIIFDELVTVDKPLEKVIVTPPQRNTPIIRAQNNKVIVELRDTLKENTTYTIDFTDAIVDNNEQNPIENFSLTFSTGDVIDSLAISGKVLDASNLEPVSGMYVGIHSDLSDTAFTKLPFLRISRTNDLGYFSIKGVAPGKYKIYALNDQNRDYKYDNPDEAIAFYDSIVIPSFEPAIRFDSIFNSKTLLFDSLKEVTYNRLLPDDIVLRSFTSTYKRQYLQKHERLTDDLLTIYFGARTQMPEVELINIPDGIKDWSVLERTAGNDTLNYWLTDSVLVKMDTLKLRVSYLMTDTLNQLQPQVDTLNFINRNKKKNIDKEEQKKKELEKKKKRGKEEVEEEGIFLSIASNISAPFDIDKNIKLEFDYPLRDFNKEKLKLQYNPDSIFENIDFQLIEDTLNPRKAEIKYKWKPDGNYRLAIDSATLNAYNGLTNKKIEMDFKIQSIDKYGALDLVIHNLPPSTPSFVELLDKSDNPVAKSKVVDNVATFLYLKPNIYYARITLDTNGNGVWDPGDYEKGISPELVLYYDKTFDIKANWDIEEDWNILGLPLDKQKPLEITKNKPKDNEKRKRDMERRDAKKAKNSSTNSSTNTNNGQNNLTPNYNQPY